MSYGLRNTIILLCVLILISGTGVGYIYYFQHRVITELDTEVEDLIAEYDVLSTEAELFPVYEAEVERGQSYIDSFDKTLFLTGDPDQVFKLLSEISLYSPEVEFNFIYNSTTNSETYGILSSSISGIGPYRQVYNFLNRIENSMPVQKIFELVVTPVNQPEEYGRVSFSFRLDSYYDRAGNFTTPEEDYLIALREPDNFHNPFFPLIRDVEPNINELPNVENSRLIGVGSDRIFISDQNGQLVTLSVGDRVYLGSVTSIDMQQRIAEFRLNKGGIIETFTLEVTQ